jgi:hypothetical protein
MAGAGLARLTLALGIAAAAYLSLAQLAQYLTWERHDALVDTIHAGQIDARDLARLQRLFDPPGITDCHVLHRRSLTVLQLYAIQLRAQQIGANPFLPSDDAQLTAMRQSALRHLTRTLACAPMDGDMWLSLALISRSLGQDPDLTARYLAQSARYAPHERWISGRRDSLF